MVKPRLHTPSLLLPGRLGILRKTRAALCIHRQDVIIQLPCARLGYLSGCPQAQKRKERPALLARLSTMGLVGSDEWVWKRTEADDKAKNCAVNGIALGGLKA
jgi:hypothetical protein